MKEGKDIVDISASFVAGIASGSLILRFGGNAFLCTSLCVFVLFPFAFFLGKKVLLDHDLQYRKMSCLHVLLFLTGIFCFSSEQISRPFNLSLPFLNEVPSQLAKSVSRIIDQFPATAPESKSMMKALVLGDKGDLGKEVIDAFRESGAAHILALSGLHIGILYSILHSLLRTWGNRPSIQAARTVTILLISGTYVLATGSSPSLVRAFLFILLNECTHLMHRQMKLSHTLCSALFIQLVLDPLSIKELGFQLSYLAMAGICWIYPLLKNRNLHFPLLQKIWNLASLTISCQIFTAPLVLYHFKTIPTYFLITNLVAIPLTTLTMGITVLMIALGSIKIFPTFLGKIGNHIIQILIDAMEIISHI